MEDTDDERSPLRKEFQGMPCPPSATVRLTWPSLVVAALALLAIGAVTMSTIAKYSATRILTASVISRSDAAAGSDSPFPPSEGPQGILVPTGAVDCGVAEDARMILSSSGICGDDIKASLDEMVAALPGQSGAGRPDYSKLSLLVLYDPCMLKASFWDPANADFKRSEGMNYRKLGLKHLDVANVRQNFGYVGGEGQAMDDSWCYDEWTARADTGGEGDVGIPPAGHASVSIMDHMMTPEEFGTLMKVALGQKGVEEARSLLEELRDRPVPQELAELIGGADIVAVSGGNPDLMAFVFRAFPMVTEALAERVRSGHTIYLGRSAGAMVAGANAVFSDQPSPDMLQALLGGDGAGLQLLEGCIVKPHYKAASHSEQVAAVEALTGQRVVTLPNRMALVCLNGKCRYEGRPRSADLQYGSLGDYRRATRIAAVFKSLRARSRR